MAEIVRLQSHRSNETALATAIEGFYASADFAESTRAVYEATLINLQQDLPADISLAEVDRQMLQSHLDSRYGQLAPATYNRNRATLGSLFSWCEDNELIVRSPLKGIRTKKLRKSIQAERQDRPIPLEELADLWSDTRYPLRDRLFWAMAYDTAARASELLSVNIENIDQANREAIIIGKGGSAERIYWTSTSARLLPRLINGRTDGPLFIGERKPRSHVAPAASDLCPITGKARLGYRQAERIFSQASGGKTLHQLRHSKITHLAEAGEDITMIKGKSRHSSLRTLERYANPSPDAIRALTNRHDVNKR